MKRKNNQTFTTDEFIQKSKMIHGDKYDYSQSVYVNKRSKIKIICPIHGLFEQTAYCHYYFKQGCPNCKKNKQLTTDEFIQKSKMIHGDKYDYSLVEYINAHTKVKILCYKHGMFEMRPSDHYKSGCSLCNLGYIKNNNISVLDFIEKSKFVHGDKYDYSKTKYVNSRSKVDIICKKHGIFNQKAESHIRGRGCPKCIQSHGEQQIEIYLNNNNYIFKHQKKFKDCIYKNYLFFDFYLPEYNCCIEYDGKQHFEAISYFGGIKAFEENLIRDKIKNEYCKNNNIHLIRISYKEDIITILNQELTKFLNN